MKNRKWEYVNHDRMLNQEPEEQCPVFMAENMKLRTIAVTLTGLHLMYGILYLFMCMISGIGYSHGLLILLQSFFSLFWFMLMIHSGKPVTVLFFLFRAAEFFTISDAITEIYPYMSFLLLLISVIPLMLDLLALLFCLYLLFNPAAAQTVRLNRRISRELISGRISPGSPEKMAPCHNACADEEQDAQDKEG